MGGEVARERGAAVKGADDRRYVCSREAKLAALIFAYDLKTS